VIFIAAIFIKLNLAEWIYSEVGPSFYHTLSEPINGRTTWYFEVYIDAEYYYESYLDAFRSGWNPYLRYTDELDFYVYGPVFIYGLYFTSLLVQLFTPTMPNDTLIQESVKWTAINFDALSVVMVYLIIINFSFIREKRIYKHIIGLIGAFAFIFMPFNVFYVDAYYLNIPQMTFFTLVTFYLVMKKKYSLSAISLTLAWLTKQMPLFLVIPIFSMIWKENDLKTAGRKFLLPFLLSTFLISIPWIFLSPVLYIGRILAAGRSLWYVTLDPSGNGHGTTLAHTFLYWGAEGLADFYVKINTPMIPFLIFYVFSLFIGHFNGKKLANDDKAFTYYITWVILISHTFISRGLFKYYDAFYTPFFILSTVAIVNTMTNRISDYIRRIKAEELISENKDEAVEEPWKIGVKSLDILSILLITLGIYYYSWIIMIESRFLHPFFLLILTFVISFLIPLDYYSELGSKTRYKELVQDFKAFFKPSFTSMLFMLIGISGAIMQFSVFHLPNFLDYRWYPLYIFMFIFSLLAIGVGFLAVVFSMFKIHKIMWILCSFLLLVFTLIFPIVILIQSGIFLYVTELHLYGNIIDFIGFWIAIVGGLFSLLFGLLLPKNYRFIYETKLFAAKVKNLFVKKAMK
jgi:hypothetical protein